MSPVHLSASIPNRISAGDERFEKSHANHDPGEIVVNDHFFTTGGARPDPYPTYAVTMENSAKM